ncbi:hypothetical protein LSO07_24785 [Janthinobacterium sp. PLB04]|uniref:Uncharacterized protein n=1 Tax=Janthinobacterium lividum TaxID=29581 RepID=A0AAJ4T547_9BURK|nr:MULTISPECIES: hypothetical protein [Janthinobacterium]KAB0326661.1 hypothetical protein F3B38_24455 [Janthinobacterium lividum]QSX95792.1 hypothetical protein J3P46_24645 [Janthinobacterium lividum]UGQ35650.1 hypothetical protein LSO07_24785 [Janthinobacterium sp. PLB04]
MPNQLHPALAQVRQLGLITNDELDDAIAELEIIELQRKHNEEEDIDVPKLAAGAGLVDTLAWLLLTDLLPQDAFFQRVSDLPRQHGGAALLERQQLATEALKLVNGQAIDTLYDEDLIDQWQRDAAHASLSADRLLASPVAALRAMLRQGTLSAPQFEALRLRTRQRGSELGRIIVEGVAQQARRKRPAYARPGTWVMAVLLLVAVLAVAGRSITSRPQPSPAAGQDIERPDLQPRAAQAVESARLPGAAPDLSITVVQDDATPPAR